MSSNYSSITNEITYIHVRLPPGLQDGHGREAARAQGGVGGLVGAAGGVDGVEVGASGINAAEDEVGADVALVPEMEFPRMKRKR